MKTRTLTRKVLIGLAISLVFAGTYPVSYLLCPEWNVTVVDISGTPVKGITVHRTCNDYSSRKIGLGDDAITDESGKASFPAKRVRSPVFLRWAGNVVNVASQGVHASFGRYCYVFAFGLGLEGSPVVNGYYETWTGTPDKMESRIVQLRVVILRSKIMHIEIEVPEDRARHLEAKLHIIRSMKGSGKAACILTNGVLFRGNAEATIRQKLVRSGILKDIIGLPANLFYGTGLPACILVLDKENAAGGVEKHLKNRGVQA